MFYVEYVAINHLANTVCVIQSSHNNMKCLGNILKYVYYDISYVLSYDSCACLNYKLQRLMNINNVQIRISFNFL